MHMRMKPGAGWWHRRAALLLLPALLLVALAPRGYMPDADALRRGQVALTLCRVVAEPGVADAGLLSQDVPCPFALLSTWHSPPAPPLLPERVEIQSTGLVIQGEVQISRGVPGGGLGARGPPLA